MNIIIIWSINRYVPGDFTIVIHLFSVVNFHGKQCNSHKWTELTALFITFQLFIAQSFLDATLIPVQWLTCAEPIQRKEAPEARLCYNGVGLPSNTHNTFAIPTLLVVHGVGAWYQCIIALSGDVGELSVHQGASHCIHQVLMSVARVARPGWTDQGAGAVPMTSHCWGDGFLQQPRNKQHSNSHHHKL